MFCDKCGNKLDKDSSFCDRCGHSFMEESKPNFSQFKFRIPSFLKKLNLKELISHPSSASIIMLLAVIAGGIITFAFYESYQIQREASFRELEKIQNQLEQVQSSTTESVAKLANENEKLKRESNELKSTIQSNSQKQQISSNGESISQDLLKKIMSRIVQVKCYQGNTVSIGSGSIQAPVGGSNQWNVYTNLHVTGLNSVCNVNLPQGVDYYPSKTYPATLEKVGTYFPDIDFAILRVNNATEFFNEFPLPTCSVADIKIGDRVTTFGYPSFGGDSLTVTDGIVSGIEYTAYGAVYKTSAKIDKGNSGGLAIDNNSKCGIGIPTWATSGAFEGLGYIQSWDMIKKSGNL